MKTKDILGSVESAIKNRKPSGSAKWFLAWSNGEIACVPTCKIPQPEVIFYKFSMIEALEGFTPKQWTRIFGEVHAFLKQKGLL